MERIPELVGLLRQPTGEQSDAQAAGESALLEEVAIACSQLYAFTGDGIPSLFSALLEGRLISPDWAEGVPPDQKLRVLQCIRLLVRDGALTAQFVDLGGVGVLAEEFGALSQLHFTPDPPPFASEILVECASIAKKLVADESYWPLLVRERVYETLVRLLRTTDASLLPSVLVALIGLASRAEHAELIGELDSIEVLLIMLEDYDAPFAGLAADLLHLLTRQAGVRAQLLQMGGLSKVYGMLCTEDPRLLQSLLRVICNMAIDPAAVAETRQIGGVPVLVSLLSPGGAGAGEGPGAGSRAREGAAAAGTGEEISPSLARIVCSALTRLSTDDDITYQVRQSNGVYFLGRLLMRPIGGGGALSKAPSIDDMAGGAAPAAAAAAVGSVHAYALRTLRFVFSNERNRKVFKRLFPPELFVAFIDAGHYVHDITPYEALAAQVAALPSRAAEAMASALEDINIFKDTSLRVVRGYHFLELLGTGAFGSVYQARKSPGDSMYAVKELPVDDVMLFGATQEEQAQGCEEMLREVQILSSLDHTNIIHYYESFQEGKFVYIVMELVDGVTLLDYITSLKEKGRWMPEDQVWQVFTQMMLALHYIHVEKQIVHRDFTPANIMLGHFDKVVKIADFGLAKQKTTGASVMQSAVGTITYSCPEIVQHEEYTDKADVWSLGCVLYHLLMLRSPFGGDNPLSIASKIVEGQYDPVPEDRYSPELRRLVGRLLTVSPDKRPSITEVSALMSPVLVAELERLQKDNVRSLQALAFERERRQWEALVAFRNEAAYKTVLAAGGSGSPERGGTSRERPGAIVDAVDLPPPSESFNLSATPNFSSESLVSMGAGGSKESIVKRLELPGARAMSLGKGETTNRTRPSPKITISNNKLRPITDPVAQILGQLHKVMYLAELPPGLQRDPRRSCVEKFKRHLFAQHMNAGSIKSELAKLLSGSNEQIEAEMVPLERLKSGRQRRPSGGDGSLGASRMSFSKLRALIEELLIEKGYYDHNNR